MDRFSIWCHVGHDYGSSRDCQSLCCPGRPLPSAFFLHAVPCIPGHHVPFPANIQVRLVVVNLLSHFSLLRRLTEPVAIPPAVLSYREQRATRTWMWMHQHCCDSTTRTESCWVEPVCSQKCSTVQCTCTTLFQICTPLSSLALRTCLLACSCYWLPSPSPYSSSNRQVFQFLSFQEYVRAFSQPEIFPVLKRGDGCLYCFHLGPECNATGVFLSQDCGTRRTGKNFFVQEALLRCPGSGKENFLCDSDGRMSVTPSPSPTIPPYNASPPPRLSGSLPLHSSQKENNQWGERNSRTGYLSFGGMSKAYPEPGRREGSTQPETHTVT